MHAEPLQDQAPRFVKSMEVESMEVERESRGSKPNTRRLFHAELTESTSLVSGGGVRPCGPDHRSRGARNHKRYRSTWRLRSIPRVSRSMPRVARPHRLAAVTCR